MGIWNAATSIFWIILLALSFEATNLHAQDKLSEVEGEEEVISDEGVAEGELQAEEDLQTGSFSEDGTGLVTESLKANTFFDQGEEQFEKYSIKNIFGDESNSYLDPFTGKMLTPNQYKNLVDTEVMADVSWRLEDKSSIDQDNIFFKGQSFSLINWKELDVKNWTDFDTWKANRDFRDNNPDWVIKMRERTSRELVGKVISCVGKCFVYSGKERTIARHLSRIYEGDEFETLKDSYAWIFLVDGTLIRVSPETSLSLNEVDVSKEKFFYYARLNQGHMLWYSRIVGKLKSSELHETDTLFLPLKMHEANIENFLRKKYQNLSPEQKMEEIYAPINANKEQTAELNKLMIENSKFGKKDSEVLLVLPNSTINAENAVVEVFVEAGNETLIRSRDIKFLYEDDIEFDPKVFLFFRGYNNSKSRTLSLGRWYSVRMDGREYSELDEYSQTMSRSEFLTKRIPTILLARELMLQKNGLDIFRNDLGYEDFAFKTGYRLWNYNIVGQEDRTYELSRRKTFLVEYTRRIETTNLRSLFTLLDNMEAEGQLNLEGFSDKYVDRALRDYFFTVSNRFSDDRDVVKEYKDSQYYIWNLSRSKGN